MDLKNVISDRELLKKLNNNNSTELTDEIRQFLIEKVSQNGGHLASNLGVVELTLALHKVFNFPEDKIVFDVGHQSYVHKILSGRENKFDNLRKLGGLSGFPKTDESEFDCFNTGHSSTSVSASLGIAKARDLNNEKFDVISLIGDGALTGGMAFEALNDAGASKTKLIVVLNDNEMSINRNVGGLSSHLSMLRFEKKYISAKSKLHSFFNKLGCFGEWMTKIIKSTKNAIKFAAIQAPLFEELGFAYIGIIDGHNIDELTEALLKAKNMTGPVLVHVHTKKGKGYKPAEDNPDIYHGISPQKKETKYSHSNNQKAYTKIFEEYMFNKGAMSKNVVAITAAMCTGCGLGRFAAQYPKRFFDVGIAEQHAVTFAAGLATRNISPVFSVYSTFLQRAYDQILHDICLQNLHVVFAIDRAGVVGEDGETHQGIYDLSYLTHMPNMKILAPSCEKEFEEMLDYALDECDGPVAVRYPKSTAPIRKFTKNPDFAPELICGTKHNIVILSVGRMLETSIKIAEDLCNSGIENVVYNVGCVKPFKCDNIPLETAQLIVTIEDNITSGGAGQYMCSEIKKIKTNDLKTINIGYENGIICQGSQEELFNKYGLTPDKIAAKIKEVINYEF